MSKTFTKKEYADYVKKKEPKSKLPLNMAKAFWVGGAICTFGQLLKELYMYLGLSLEEATNIMSISLIFLGVTLTALTLYEKLGKYAGAGSAIPITGFANSVSSPAIEFKSEGFIFGMASKMFVIAGPVLVYGITTSIIIGILYYLIR